MKSLNKYRALRFTSALVISACCAVVFGSIVFSRNLNRVMTSWAQDVQMAVYLADDVNSADQEKIETFLKSQKSVQQFHLVTQEKALADFRVQLATYAPDLVQDEGLLKLIPASYEIQLSDDISAQARVSEMESLSNQLKGFGGVEEVSYGQDWLQKYSAVLNAAESASWIVGLVIGIACLFVMSNSIRALVNARKEEIEILELIGATKSMIRKPFLVEGALTGFISSSIGVVVVLLLSQTLVVEIEKQELLRHLTNLLQFPSIVFISIFIFTFTALGAIGSYLSVSRINNGWAATLK